MAQSVGASPSGLKVGLNVPGLSPALNINFELISPSIMLVRSLILLISSAHSAQAIGPLDGQNRKKDGQNMVEKALKNRRKR